MPFIGVRELREHTAEVLRQIREAQAEYIITHQGQPVALLLPLDMKMVEAAIVQTTIIENPTTWAQFAILSDSVRQQWPEDAVSSAVLDEIRES
ncbi:MAG: type II toxin-antitoxin system Phd/YefM family antitoxin [Chloroflexi bacterium]|nr:type II toxin-antitoxin system Phd/YefM family antitoxin [Chloroflexota bacterium]